MDLHSVPVMYYSIIKIPIEKCSEINISELGHSYFYGHSFCDFYILKNKSATEREISTNAGLAI